MRIQQSGIQMVQWYMIKLFSLVLKVTNGRNWGRVGMGLVLWMVCGSAFGQTNVPTTLNWVGELPTSVNGTTNRSVDLGNFDNYLDINLGHSEGQTLICEDQLVELVVESAQLVLTEATSDLGSFRVEISDLTNTKSGRIYLPDIPNSNNIILTFDLILDVRLVHTDPRVVIYRTNEFCAGESEQKIIERTFSISDQTLAVNYESQNSLTPFAEYTFPESVCESEAINIEISAFNPGSVYKLREGGTNANTDHVIASSTSRVFSLTSDDLEATWNPYDEAYIFIVTEYTPDHYEVIG